MQKYGRHISLGVSICFVMLQPLFGEQDSQLPEPVKAIVQQARGNEDTVFYYGKVLDQFGAPVVGASVTVHLFKFSIIPAAPEVVDLLTDVNGCFSIAPGDKGLDLIKATNLSVSAIKKVGFESCRSEWPDTYTTFLKNRPDRHRAEKGNPVIYRMRKKEPVESYLLGEVDLKFQVYASETGKVIGFDFIQRGPIRDVANPPWDDAKLVCDFQVQATCGTNASTWTVVLAPGQTNGGILVSDQLLYEAPEAGYQSSFTFTPVDHELLKAHFIYLKSREPAIYTRLEVEYINANEEFFRLSGKSFTNPYGDRNLEQATDLPFEITKQLEDEAKAAFRQNKRPAKPDLQLLMKEAKPATLPP